MYSSVGYAGAPSNACQTEWMRNNRFVLVPFARSAPAQELSSTPRVTPYALEATLGSALS